MGHLLVDRSRHRPGAALLRFAVAGLSFLFVVALAGLVVVEVHPSWLARLRNGPPAPVLGRSGGSRGATLPLTGVDNPRHPHGGPATGSAPAAGVAGRSTPAGGAAAKAPVLAALQPTTGRPGQRLELTGRNLFSPDGLLQLTFAGHLAPVRCPTEDRCIVTVPPLGGHPRTTPVSLLTAAGRSNVLAFAYR